MLNQILLPRLTGWDYLVIVVYLCLVTSIGFILKKVSRNASDFFRGGGNMLWWMCGVSALMAGISTYSFTAMSGRAYKDGVVFMLFMTLGSAILLPVGLWAAPRFRQMRVITSLEAVCRRYGFGTEQFYTWFILPQGLFWGGIGLNTVSVFMASAFQLDMYVTMTVLGAMTTILAMMAGQWGVAVSDFVQGVVMYLIVLVVIFFSVNLPEIGGFGNLTNVLPDRYFELNVGGARPAMVVLGLIMSPLFSLFYTFDIQGNGTKFLMVKNGKHARRMVLLMFVVSTFMLSPLLLQLPAFCASVVFPDMSRVYPNLKFPEEGVFVAMAFKTLPPGLLGLLLCGMFAASMTSMDTALNRNAGYFVRNVYIKYLHRGADEKRQLLVGRLATVGFGLIMVLVGMTFHKVRLDNIFDMYLKLNSLIMLPLMLPTSLGILWKRTPPWAGWSTVLVGVLAGIAGAWVYSPELIETIMGYDYALIARERVDSESFFIAVFVLFFAVGWFFLTSLWYKKAKPEFREGVESFFKDMRTPIDAESEHIVNQDDMQYATVGFVAIMFGVAILAGALIPNPLSGRLAFLFIGGTVTALGGLLRWQLWRKKRKEREAQHE